MCTGAGSRREDENPQAREPPTGARGASAAMIHGHRRSGKTAILPPMTLRTDLSLQERFAPEGRCFGCGPANPVGLRIRSFRSDDSPEQLVAEWRPSPDHEAFAGVVNGGIIGTLLDCHSNWTAANHLMLQRGVDRPPTTVTLDYAVRLRRPTPSTGPLRLRAWVAESAEDRATIDAEIFAAGEVTATCRGTFVAVRPGHPAYDRW
jgi:acyl-coenzyme A thioesterase PaaI-like protein